MHRVKALYQGRGISKCWCAPPAICQVARSPSHNCTVPDGSGLIPSSRVPVCGRAVPEEEWGR